MIATRQDIDVDFRDYNDIYGYGHLLISQAQKAGLMTFTTAPSEGYDIICRIKQWIKWLDTNITHLPLSGLSPILDIFDLLHRLAYGRPDHRFIATWHNRILQAWATGDKSIPEITILQNIRHRLESAPLTVPERQAMHYFQAIERWIKESENTGRFTTGTLAEAFQRLAILLKEDLFAYLPDQKAYKHKLIAAYTPYFNDLSAMDIPTLKALLTLTAAITPTHQTIDEMARHESDIIRHLTHTPTLNKHDREAYELDMIYLTSQNTQRTL